MVGIKWLGICMLKLRDVYRQNKYCRIQLPKQQKLKVTEKEQKLTTNEVRLGLDSYIS